MERVVFHEGALPSGIVLGYEPAIFNMPAFTALQSPASTISFYLIDASASKALAGIHFCCDNYCARTPFRAPFGSIECAPGIQPALLYRFLEDMEMRLKHNGITDILIRNPPRAHAPEKWSLIETFLLNQQYSLLEAEVSMVISVTDQSFTDHIRPSEKLRHRQGLDAGFIVQQLTSDALGTVYRFIAACHYEKGYQLSITEADLRQAVYAFPERYLLFAVFHQQEMVAAAVAVRVKHDILYSFLINHQRVFNHLSPPVLLIEAMYTYCCANSIKLLDLGTSALHGEPNFSLLDFKSHLGGVPTSKFSFSKKTG